jgi:deazaflavin-dependent oxidoreductase (nitroreductase family)
VAEAQTGAAAARRRTRLLQRYLLNPPVKLAVMLGMSPRHMLVETRGRKTGKRRRNVVGYTGGGDTLWVVAEQGRHAGYVANLLAQPQVRLMVHRRWRDATAHVLDDDDPVARLKTFGDDNHAALVQRFGTSLLTIRFDLSG